jgi:NAD(P)H-quinone oxidoreductase subunit 2
MMVVKESQEASDAVKAYPEIRWNLAGMQPLRLALVGCVLVTAVGGILSSPLFEWASSTVAGTPILQQALAAAPVLPLG